MLNKSQLKNVFGPYSGEMTTAQGNLIETTGNQIAGILEAIEGKVAPEFYDHVARAFVTAQSQLTLAVAKGWKGSY